VLRCTGLLSRCVQHEVDHLNGVSTSTDDEGRARLIDPELKALKKQTREAEKK